MSDLELDSWLDLPKKRKAAVFTLVKNEGTFLPLWLRYYRQFFEDQDIYVLDHQSTDGSTDNLGVSTTLVENDTVFDVDWLRHLASDAKNSLLERYDIVIYAEADEFVAAPKLAGGLREYIEKFKGDAVACNGFNVLHYPDKEPAIDLSRPLMEQRSLWAPHHLTCKPLLSRISLDYGPGCHTSIPQPNIDPDLYLIHMHQMDIEIAWKASQRWSKLKWHEKTLKNNWCFQHAFTERQKFEEFFFKFFKDVQDIPPEVKKVII